MMSHTTQWRMPKAESWAGEHETLGIFPKPKHTVQFLQQTSQQGHAVSKLTFTMCADLKTIHQAFRKMLSEEEQKANPSVTTAIHSAEQQLGFFPVLT